MSSDAEKGIDNWDKIPCTLPSVPENCFDHELAEKEGTSSVAIYNHKLKLGVMLTADCTTLDRFTQWKTFPYRDYALGFEYASTKLGDRKKMYDEGLLKFIAPDEIVNFNLKITILEGDEGLKTARDRMNYLLK